MPQTFHIRFLLMALACGLLFVARPARAELQCLLALRGDVAHAPNPTSPHVHNSTPRQSASTPATFGGAQYGYESTLSQQLRYLQNALPKLLAGWGYTLHTDGLYIDSEKDFHNQFFPRYKTNARQEVVPLQFIPRSVTFYFQNTNGQTGQGHIYLIEQISPPQGTWLNTNSTTQEGTELQFDQTLRFALASTLNPVLFAFELQHSDFHFTFTSSPNAAAASSAPQLVTYVREKLESFLAPHGLDVLAESIDVAYYYDHRVIMRFADREGRLVSFLARDTAGKLYAGTTNLWLASDRRRRILYQRNSTLAYVHDPLLNQNFELWLATGYTNLDAGLELTKKNFGLRPLNPSPALK